MMEKFGWQVITWEKLLNQSTLLDQQLTKGNDAYPRVVPFFCGRDGLLSHEDPPGQPVDKAENYKTFLKDIVRGYAFQGEKISSTEEDTSKNEFEKLLGQKAAQQLFSFIRHYFCQSLRNPLKGLSGGLCLPYHLELQDGTVTIEDSGPISFRKTHEGNLVGYSLSTFSVNVSKPGERGHTREFLGRTVCKLVTVQEDNNKFALKVDSLCFSSSFYCSLFAPRTKDEGLLEKFLGHTGDSEECRKIYIAQWQAQDKAVGTQTSVFFKDFVPDFLWGKEYGLKATANDRLFEALFALNKATNFLRASLEKSGKEKLADPLARWCRGQLKSLEECKTLEELEAALIAFRLVLDKKHQPAWAKLSPKMLHLCSQKVLKPFQEAIEGWRPFSKAGSLWQEFIIKWLNLQTKPRQGEFVSSSPEAIASQLEQWVRTLRLLAPRALKEGFVSLAGKLRREQPGIFDSPFGPPWESVVKLLEQQQRLQAVKVSSGFRCSQLQRVFFESGLPPSAKDATISCIGKPCFQIPVSDDNGGIKHQFIKSEKELGLTSCKLYTWPDGGEAVYTCTPLEEGRDQYRHSVRLIGTVKEQAMNAVIAALTIHNNNPCEEIWLTGPEIVRAFASFVLLNVCKRDKKTVHGTADLDKKLRADVSARAEIRMTQLNIIPFSPTPGSRSIPASGG